MKKYIFLSMLVFSAVQLVAQTKTTLALQEKYGEVVQAYFYKNTLRMLNQKDDPAFDDLIRNVEKMKFLMVSKEDKGFGNREYTQLIKDYKAEHYEPIVTSRLEGRNFDIYLNDKKGSKPGTVVLVNDSTNLYVLDIIGTIDMSKAGALFNAIDGWSDFGNNLRGNKSKKRPRSGFKID